MGIESSSALMAVSGSRFASISSSWVNSCRIMFVPSRMADMAFIFSTGKPMSSRMVSGIRLNSASCFSNLCNCLSDGSLPWMSRYDTSSNVE